MADAIHAWHPDVPLVQEVLHARFEHHAYPSHTHDSWTVLLVDQGTVTYDLGRQEHQTSHSAVTLLPPQVPHDGRSATPDAPFRKRVLYLDPEWLPDTAIDAAVETPTLFSPDATATVDQIHSALNDPADVLAAECGVLALRELVQPHLRSPASTAADKPLARRLRQLLDDRLTETITITEAAADLSAHRSHLVRVFTQAYGIAPHQYVVGRRVDRARRLLLSGYSPAEAAAKTGFHDQSHLTRHFRRTLGTTPGVFAA